MRAALITFIYSLFNTNEVNGISRVSHGFNQIEVIEDNREFFRLLDDTPIKDDHYEAMQGYLKKHGKITFTSTEQIRGFSQGLKFTSEVEHEVHKWDAPISFGCGVVTALCLVGVTSCLGKCNNHEVENDNYEIN